MAFNSSISRAHPALRQQKAGWGLWEQHRILLHGHDPDTGCGPLVQQISRNFWAWFLQQSHWKMELSTSLLSVQCRWKEGMWSDGLYDMFTRRSFGGKNRYDLLRSLRIYGHIKWSPLSFCPMQYFVTLASIHPLLSAEHISQKSNWCLLLK